MVSAGWIRASAIHRHARILPVEIGVYRDQSSKRAAQLRVNERFGLSQSFTGAENWQAVRLKDYDADKAFPACTLSALCVNQRLLVAAGWSMILAI